MEVNGQRHAAATLLHNAHFRQASDNMGAVTGNGGEGEIHRPFQESLFQPIIMKYESKHIL
jgi:hypothetical protein